jgi:pyruvate carboxylase
VQFIGPPPEVLELFGDKVRARRLAQQCGVPVLDGTESAASFAQAKSFLAAADSPIVIKAVAGGGGRGMRVVRRAEELEEAFKRCQSEARAAFGNGDVYGERFMPAARHIEVQILGDRSGKVTHLWERECTIQRRHQKLIEIAPSFGITPKLRARVIDAAIRLAEAAKYDVLGTFEFLVAADGGDQAHFAFIEANPRLQVEHTVTEQVTGVDLVRAQLELASGRSLTELDLLPAGPGAARMRYRSAHQRGNDGGRWIGAAGERNCQRV